MFRESKGLSENLRALSVSSPCAEDVTGAIIDQAWPEDPPQSGQCPFNSICDALVFITERNSWWRFLLPPLSSGIPVECLIPHGGASVWRLLVADERPYLDCNLVSKDSLRGEKIYHSSQLTSVGILSEWFGPLANYCQRRTCPYSLCSSQPQVPSTRGPQNLSRGNLVENANLWHCNSVCWVGRMSVSTTADPCSQVPLRIWAGKLLG